MGSVSMVDGHVDETKVEALIRLIKENPTLPVVPMVDYEIVGEDWGRWMGSFGYSEVSEFALYDDRYYEDRDSFKEAYFDNNEEEICERFGCDYCISEYGVKTGKYTQEQFEANAERVRLAEEYLDSIADEYFVKAIIVNIDTPEYV